MINVAERNNNNNRSPQTANVESGPSSLNLGTAIDDDDDSMCITPTSSTPRRIMSQQQRKEISEEDCLLLEYLPWMGTEVLDSPQDSGILRCHHCRQSLGSWSWSLDDKSPLVIDYGKGEFVVPPFIRVDKKSVSEVK